MVTCDSIRQKGWTYTIQWDPVSGWFFTRSKGKSREIFPLDHDKRHARFFLTEEDQKYVGIDGIVVLEKMTRRILPR